MVYCPKSGQRNEDDAKYCKNCGAALYGIIEGGFKVGEIPEYLGRKTLSIVMMFVGFIILFFSFFKLIASFFGDLHSYVGFFIGMLMILYGEHYWSKVTHIMWLRQAFREYGLLSVKEVKDYLKEPTVFSEKIDGLVESYVGMLSKEIQK